MCIGCNCASPVAKQALKSLKERNELNVLASLGALEEMSIDKWLNLQGDLGTDHQKHSTRCRRRHKANGAGLLNLSQIATVLRHGR